MHQGTSINLPLRYKCGALWLKTVDWSCPFHETGNFLKSGFKAKQFNKTVLI